MSFENEYVKSKQKRSAMGPFLPAIGLILIVCFAAIAFVASEPLTEVLRENMAEVPDDEEVSYVVGFIVFLGLLLITGLLFAMFAPKPPKMVTEQELKKERQQVAREKEARKKRKRAANLKMAREREQQEGR